MINRTKLIYQNLKEKYKRATISKAEYADEVGQRVGTEDRLLTEAWKKQLKANSSYLDDEILQIIENEGYMTFRVIGNGRLRFSIYNIKLDTIQANLLAYYFMKLVLNFVLIFSEICKCF